MAASRTTVFPVRDYDLAGTLTSGQAFRWRERDGSWLGVIGACRVKLSFNGAAILAETSEPMTDWCWLADYLQVDADLATIVKTFPDDEPMRQAVAGCRGLRLLRQDPWECLASFILSSTKRIVQIQQIVEQLCRQFGEPLGQGAEGGVEYSFPDAARLAAATETELRGCKMGFRAPYLLAAARDVSERRIDLHRLRELPVSEARAELMQLPGVGRKIADCVLLFAYGFPTAFPLDVWVTNTLRQLYFSGRKVSLRRLEDFAATHFGPHAGYAQQYLFHYARTKMNHQFTNAHEKH